MDVVYSWWCFAKFFWMDAQDFQLRRYTNHKVFIALNSDDNWSFWSLNTFRATVKIQIFDGTIKSDEKIEFGYSIIKNSCVIFFIGSDLFFKIPFFFKMKVSLPIYSYRGPSLASSLNNLLYHWKKYYLPRWHTVEGPSM